MLQKLLIAATAFAALASAAQAQTPPSPEQCAQAWSAVAANQTPAALEQFIAAFSACPEADQARQDLVALSSDDESGPNVAEVPATSPPPSDGVSSDDGLGGYVLGGVLERTLPGSSAPGSATPPPPAPGPGPGFNVPADRTVYVPAGRLLGRGDPMIAEGGGYGVILLRRGASENLAACQVFVRSLGFTNTRDDGLVEQVDGVFVYRRPIYWPTLHDISATRASDCSTVLANYDYDRAAIMLARLRATNRAGPFMVIWRANGASAGLFDYSELSQIDLDRQFDRSLFNLAQSDRIWDPAFYEPNAFNRSLRALISGVAEPAKCLTATLLSFSRPGLVR